MKRYNIQFPPIDATHVDQDQAYFYLVENGHKDHVQFHDYARIYDMPGLYEQLYYERLKCNSPQKVTAALRHTIDVNKEHFSEMKVLDFGAGNGMMGEELKRIGVARLVGVDILPEAKTAAERDRPGVYDEFYVRDFLQLTPDEIAEFEAWNLNALTTVAALGFGDIPPMAFIQALNLIAQEGWVAFNIKETFLYNTDTTGFSRLIRELIFSEYLNLNHLERYRHRLSIEGSPLHYFSVVCWKKAHVPLEFLEQHGIC
ncbi:MAG: methyltransferase [Chloroflexi bacterium]|nr:methyltransferase [Chloroflexota bacterium]